jgi:GNAT superfamily N-acetyltransferase
MATIADATPDRWDDVVEVMGTRGDPASCWCQWFRLRNADYRVASVSEKRAALCAQVDDAVPPGVLAYDDSGAPVGWCAVAPRAVYPRLETSTLVTSTDEDGLWSVTCFVVRVGSRRQGSSVELLDGAIDLARRHGARVLEAYPVDVAVKKPSSSELYHGALSVYLQAGFTEFGARPKDTRAIVRLAL